MGTIPARFLLASLSMASLATSAAARPLQESDLASGDYGGEMLIGVDPASHAVTGYYQSSTGNGQFSRIFYLTGKADGAIRTYFPETPAEVVTGRLTRDGRDSFRVRLAREHGGCWNVQHFADKDQPADFTLETAYPWISIAVVTSARAHFFGGPLSKAPRKSYVVKGDGLGVRAARPGWLQVDFIGGGKPVTGWVRRSDVYSAH